MLFRTRAANGAPLSRGLLRTVRGRFRQYSRRVILQNRDGYRLLARDIAKGCCLAEDIIVLGANPSLSCVLEELMHAIQFKTEAYNQRVLQTDNVVAGALCELEVAQVLHSLGPSCGVPAAQRADNARRLRRYRASIRATGGLPWLSSSKSQKSKSSLVRALKSLMGPSWPGKSRLASE